MRDPSSEGPDVLGGTYKHFVCLLKEENEVNVKKSVLKTARISDTAQYTIV